MSVHILCCTCTFVVTEIFTIFAVEESINTLTVYLMFDDNQGDSIKSSLYMRIEKPESMFQISLNTLPPNQPLDSYWNGRLESF